MLDRQTRLWRERPRFGGKVYTHQPGTQRGAGVSQAEPGTSAKDTWPIDLSYVYEYQLATQIEQIDRGIIHLNTLVSQYTF